MSPLSTSELVENEIETLKTKSQNTNTHCSGKSSNSRIIRIYEKINKS
jgi:hypothetical protein